MLGREVVGFRFAFLADEFGLFGALVHVQRDRAHVVEELGINGPATIFFPDGFAHERSAAVGHGLAEGKSLFADDTVAEAFVRNTSFISSFRGGSKPALIDAAAVGAVGVGVIRMKFDAQARLEE